MNLSDIVMLEMLAFFMCDNFLMRMTVAIILGIIIFGKKYSKQKFNIKNLIMGNCIIIFNCILEVDLSIINFVVLGIASFLFSKVNVNKFLNVYLMIVAIIGGINFCLNFY